MKNLAAVQVALLFACNTPRTQSISATDSISCCKRGEGSTFTLWLPPTTE